MEKEKKELIKQEENVEEVQQSIKLLRVANALFKSGLFPNVKNAYGAFAIVQYGNELGIGPMTSLQTMGIVKGKICMAAQMILALALRQGVSYSILENSEDCCEIKFKRGSLSYDSKFTIEEAKRAHLLKTDSGWEKYPKDMLFHRAVTRGLRRVSPDAIAGLYAIEEIQDIEVKEAEPKTEEEERLDQMTLIAQFNEKIPEEVDQEKLNQFLKLSADHFEKTVGQLKAEIAKNPGNFWEQFDAWLKKQAKPEKKKLPEKGPSKEDKMDSQADPGKKTPQLPEIPKWKTEFLYKMGRAESNLKDTVGEEEGEKEYYKIISEFGCTKVDEVSSEDHAQKIYQAMNKRMIELLEEGKIE